MISDAPITVADVIMDGEASESIVISDAPITSARERSFQIVSESIVISDAPITSNRMIASLKSESIVISYTLLINKYLL